jgi:hypothetical protein
MDSSVHRVNDVLCLTGQLLHLQAPPAFPPEVCSQLLQLLKSCPQSSAAVEAAPAVTALRKAPRALDALKQLLKSLDVRGSKSWLCTRLASSLQCGGPLEGQSLQVAHVSATICSYGMLV